jgi:enolase
MKRAIEPVRALEILDSRGNPRGTRGGLDGTSPITFIADFAVAIGGGQIKTPRDLSGFQSAGLAYRWRH